MLTILAEWGSGKMRKSIVHCVKSVRIRKFSGPYFPSCRLNKEIPKSRSIYSVQIAGKQGQEKFQRKTLFTQW